MTTKTNQGKTITQIEKANTALLELKPNVSTEDRVAACHDLNLSTPTVHRYLNGDARKLEIAMVLIRFFRDRIERREKELAA